MLYFACLLVCSFFQLSILVLLTLSEDGVEVHGDKQALSWSYSQYLEAMDREDVLNNVDKHTFSSLASKGRKLIIFCFSKVRKLTFN